MYDDNPPEEKHDIQMGKIMGFKCFFVVVPTLFQDFWMYIGLCWNVDICHRVCVLYKKQNKKQTNKKMALENSSFGTWPEEDNSFHIIVIVLFFVPKTNATDMANCQSK